MNFAALVDYEAAELFERFDDWLEGRRAFSLLRQLPQREQDAILLRLADCSYEQIAERMAVSRERARQIFEQGVRVLKKKYLREVSGEQPFPAKAQRTTSGTYQPISISSPARSFLHAQAKLKEMFGLQHEGAFFVGRRVLLISGHDQGLHVRVFGKGGRLIGKFHWSDSLSKETILGTLELMKG